MMLRSIILCILFSDLYSESNVFHMNAYHCTHKNITKVSTFDMKDIAQCDINDEWYPYQRPVQVQLIHYPRFQLMNATSCEILRTVEVKFCGFDGIR